MSIFLLFLVQVLIVLSNILSTMTETAAQSWQRCRAALWWLPVEAFITEQLSACLCQLSENWHFTSQCGNIKRMNILGSLMTEFWDEMFWECGLRQTCLCVVISKVQRNNLHILHGRKRLLSYINSDKMPSLSKHLGVTSGWELAATEGKRNWFKADSWSLPTSLFHSDKCWWAVKSHHFLSKWRGQRGKL